MPKSKNLGYEKFYFKISEIFLCFGLSINDVLSAHRKIHHHSEFRIPNSEFN